MGRLRAYLSDLSLLMREPAAIARWAARRPLFAAASALALAGLFASVPLARGVLEQGWERQTAASRAALERELATLEKDLLKDVPPTLTRRTGLLGMGKKSEPNPAYQQKKAEARRLAEEKQARAREEDAAGKAGIDRTLRAAWWGAGSLSLLLLLGLVPFIAAASGAPGARGKDAFRRQPDQTGTMELSAAATESAIGPEGRYLVREVIGRGTMGVVYRGWDRSLEREVAIKEMPRPLTGDTEAYQRFRREALTLARLSHPHIVQVYDLFEKEGRAFLAMEYMGGGTLAQVVEAEGRLDLPRVGSHALAVLDALSYLHAQGVIHRDLKPGNILLNERRLPKISDFGLARWDRQNDLTREGALLGSPNYMSPEQVAGKKADRRSDLYAFGALLYWMAAGSPPFEGEVEAVLALHLTRLPSPPSSRNPRVPRQLDSLIMSLMAKNPADREQDIDKIRKVLTSLSSAR